MSEFEVSGARAVVTGASSGIGELVAERLAERGADVALLARREALLEEVAERCRAHGVDAHVVPVDLGDLDAVRGAAEAAAGALGGVDLLVNNAGAPRRVHASRLSFEQIEQTMRVNYLGTMALTWALLEHLLVAPAGRIVNVSSLAGRIPAPRELAYAASKAALTIASEVLACDLADTDVRVHVITPGVIDTPLWEVEGQEASPFPGEPEPPERVVDAILDVLASGKFEAWVPPEYEEILAGKVADVDGFLAGTAAFDRANTPEAY